MKSEFARTIAHALALTLVAGMATFLAGDQYSSDRNNQFDFALIGDVPYAPTAGTLLAKYQTYPASSDYTALIADINAHNKVAFTVHVGDIKAGDTWCTGGTSVTPPPATPPGTPPSGSEDVYLKNLALFNTYRSALVYVPGDNEWTDCHRANNGGYSPLERLAYLRSVLYPGTSNQSLGQSTMTLQRQSSDPGFSLYKENVSWRTGGILFIGLNQPGSNNNHVRPSGPFIAENEAEYVARNAANIAWINKGFDTAAIDSSVRAIVILQQANPFERFLEVVTPAYTRSGYEEFVKVLRNRTIAWGKPVVLVGGDTHTVRIDKPLTAAVKADGSYVREAGSLTGNIVGYPGHSAPSGSAVVTPTTLFDQATGLPCPTTPLLGQACVTSVRVQNFTRVEVFGSPDVAWIRVIVDPFDPNVLSFATQTIAGTGHGRDGRSDDDDLQ